MSTDSRATGSSVGDLFSLRDRVAVVTGGRRGLGRAMARGLARAGANVAVIAASAKAGEVDAEVRAEGRELHYIQADLTVAAQRAGLIDRVVARFGKVDILVNNAGVQRRAAALDYPPEAWRDDMELLLTAVLDLSQQAARVMLPRRYGKIVQIASISSFQGARQIIGYATAKHGLIGLTKCLANEWAGQGINVNAIAPGIFETEMAAHVTADEKKTAEMLGRVPAGRFGTPDDIVGPLLFLASEASRHVHGAILLVDGGWMGR
jgi:2-dehydro-3-deoxy-D-gluconate 5-dehydrogenase